MTVKQLNQVAFRFSQLNFIYYLADLMDYESENVTEDDADLGGLLNEFYELVRDFFFKDGREKSIAEMIEFRNENIREAEELIRATDCFALSEFVLNRLEHLFFEPTALPEGYSDEALRDEIMTAVAYSKTEQNALLSSVLRELPVRMTKEAFYGKLMEGLSVYRGDEEDTVRNVMDSIRSVAGMDFPECEGDLYESARLLLQRVNRIRPKDFLYGEYTAESERLSRLGNQIELYFTVRENLQYTVNAFLSAFYSQDASSWNPSYLELLRQLFDLREEAAEKSGQSAFSKQLDMLLYGTEYEFEQAHNAYDTVFGGYSRESSYMLPDTLKRVVILNSSSTFAELDAFDVLKKAISDDTFDEMAAALLEDLSENFSSYGKLLTRASINAILGIIPLPSWTGEEWSEYILSSLSRCTDVSEKLGFIDIFNELKRSEDL